jgi:hypothetical protein
MMKAIRSTLAAALFALAAGGAVFGEGLEFSGLLDSTVTMQAGAGDAPGFPWGLEEYANLRMTAKLRDGLSFYGALNLIAAAGSSAPAVAASGTPAAAATAQNYAAALELERLYFRLNGEHLDFSGGLMRIAFGYGQVFGPSDFLNPKNPLYPEARPRAALGAELSYYPVDNAKLRAFGAAPRDLLAINGNGILAGLSADRHWEKASLQCLYAFESPKKAAGGGVHRAGLSVKADLALGLTAELLYTANPGGGCDVGGLSAAGGFDYSFHDGKFYLLAEYLYSGETSSTARMPENTDGFLNNSYLYGSILYRFNDYTGLTLACLAGFDDVSFAPMIRADHELLQGLTLTLLFRFPMDRNLFTNNGRRGELGPLPPGAAEGAYAVITAMARLRF